MSVATSKIKALREYKAIIFYSFIYFFIYTFLHNANTLQVQRVRISLKRGRDEWWGRKWMEKLCRPENSKLSYFRHSQAAAWAWPWCGHGVENKYLWVFLLAFSQIPNKTLGFYFHLYITQFPISNISVMFSWFPGSSEGL